VEHRALVESGVELSRVVLGGGNFGGVGSAPEWFGKGESDEAAFRIMDAAWALGITAFDTADAYGGGRSETAIGAWMRSTGNRPTLTTKTFNPMRNGGDRGLSRPRIVRQIESSLDRLGVESVDLYLAHDFDPDTPLEETVTTFEGLVGTGLVKAWGVSNFDGAWLRETLKVGRPAVVQNSYSLLDRRDDADVIPLCVEFGVAYEAYSPLAGGWLTGKYQRGEAPPADSRMTQRPEPYEHLRTGEVFDGLEELGKRAAARGVEVAALALAWVLSHPAVAAVVTGPRRPKHLAPAVAALATSLSPDERADFAALLPG
jgi:aryl-alcohol dehydrogenase-like predicted oxidoreductase